MRYSRTASVGLIGIFSIFAPAQTIRWTGVISTKECRKAPERERASCVTKSLRKKGQAPLLVVEGNVYELTRITDLERHLNGSIVVSGRLTNRVITVFSMEDVQGPAPAQNQTVPVKTFDGQSTGGEAGRISQVIPPQSPSMDEVVAMVKAGLSDSLIIHELQKDSKGVDLTPVQMVKLKNAGVSNEIIATLMDPHAPAGPGSNGSASAIPVIVATNAPKRRVIIEDFDFSSVKTSVQAIFGTQEDIGKAMRAMLVAKLAQEGNIIVVESSKVSSLMKEQDFHNSGRMKQGSTARVGRIAGADALVAGDITVFGRDDKKGAPGGLGTFGGLIGSATASKKVDKAVVSVTYRFVDAETGEVIAGGEVSGASQRAGTSLATLPARSGISGKNGGPALDMTSSNFSQTILGEAVQDCVNKLAAVLIKESEAVKPAMREVEARVADISGNNMTITAGLNDAVAVGDVFEILRIDREIKDPVTKEVLDTTVEKVGDLTITEVKDKVATGAYTGSPAQTGFMARRKLPK